MKIDRAVTITGVLTYRPELRYTPTGRELITFWLTHDDDLICCEMWGEHDVFLDKLACEMITVTGKWREHKYRGMDGEEKVRKILTVHAWECYTDVVSAYPTGGKDDGTEDNRP